MSLTAQNKAVIRRLYTEVWNGGDLQILEELFHPNVVGHERNAPDGYGVDFEKQVVLIFRNAFPDCCFILEDLVAEDNRVVAHLTVKAIFARPWFDIAPTGQPVSITGMVLYRFVAGKILESWSNWDELGFRRQLGDTPHK